MMVNKMCSKILEIKRKHQEDSLLKEAKKETIRII